MSEKCRKRPLSKNEDTKAVRHFEENNYCGDDLHTTATKSISLFNAYESLKYSPSAHSFNFSDNLVLI